MIQKLRRTSSVVALLALALALSAPVLAASAQININSATAEQLTLLPRVGPSVAARIVEFRQQNGPFKSAEDLMLVRGIGEKTFEGLRGYIAVSGETTLKDKVPSPRSAKSEAEPKGAAVRASGPPRAGGAGRCARPVLVMRRHAQGMSLIELLICLSLLGFLAAIGVPPLLQTSAQRRLELAASEVRGAMYLARSLAIRHSVNAAVKFHLDQGQLSYTLYRDGDGDGVLNADIRSGVDERHGPTHRLWHAGNDVRFGFPPGPAPRDPGDPRRRLDRLDDPIRFNASDLASFDPWGGATPGTAYMTDGTHLLAVRVPGRSARVKWLLYDPLTERWN